MRVCALIFCAACVVVGVGNNDAYAKTGKLPSVFKERATRVAAGMRDFVLPSAGRHSRLQQLIAGAGLAVVACTGVSSCGMSKSNHASVESVESEGHRVAEDLLGQEVHFMMNNSSYIGYVAETVADGKVLVKGADFFAGTDEGMELSVEQISGVLVIGHHDEKKPVFIREYGDFGVRYLHGIMIAAYDDGYRMVLVGAVIDALEKEARMLDEPYILILHRSDTFDEFPE